MAYEKLIKRILYQMKCDHCGYTEIIESNPPREKQCPDCNQWCEFKKIEWIGPDTFK